VINVFGKCDRKALLVGALTEKNQFDPSRFAISARKGDFSSLPKIRRQIMFTHERLRSIKSKQLATLR
jgi:hypothetical protein